MLLHQSGHALDASYNGTSSIANVQQAARDNRHDEPAHCAGSRRGSPQFEGIDLEDGSRAILPERPAGILPAPITTVTLAIRMALLAGDTYRHAGPTHAAHLQHGVYAVGSFSAYGVVGAHDAALGLLAAGWVGLVMVGRPSLSVTTPQSPGSRLLDGWSHHAACPCTALPARRHVGQRHSPAGRTSSSSRSTRALSLHTTHPQS